MFDWIENPKVKREAEETYKYFLNDKQTREEVSDISSQINYEALVEGVIEYCFFCPGERDCFNPYLDKKYVDYCWLQVGNAIINLDDIYDVIIDDAKEQSNK